MNKTAVVTGGSSGIGRAAADMLSQRGYAVYELSRSGKSRDGVTHVHCDVCDEQSVAAAFETIGERAGHIDILINNAGMGISGAVEFTPIEDARRIFDVNFFGGFLCVRAALPLLRRSEHAAIVNTSSVAAIAAIPYQAFYSATKAAVNMLTLALRNELKGFGISVCAVMPGDAATGFTSARKKTALGAELYGEAIQKAVASMERDERGGMTPNDVAKVIVGAALSRHPRALYVAGTKYRLMSYLIKILPATTANWIIGKMY